jgi:putative phage-type endonuclease
MDPRVEELLKRPQPKQLSAEWFAIRPSMITASSAASLLIRDDKTCDGYIKCFNLEDVFDKDGKCCNPYSSKIQYFLERCRGSSFKGSAATFWGQKYESVASDIYSNLNDTDVIEFGLLTHPRISWIGASPDGITPSGIMIEIKCPYRRKITGIPPFYYWQQCQLQLEVCDLDICDFTEFTFVEFGSPEEWLDDLTMIRGEDLKFKGLFIQIETKNPITQEILPQDNNYVYPERSLLCKPNELIDWAKEKIALLSKTSKDNQIITPVFWKVFTYCITTIKRDQKWFKDILPDFEKEWKRLEFYKRGDNYKLLLANPNKTKEEIQQHNILSFASLPGSCILSDSEDED